jgi:hypothetical protein
MVLGTISRMRLVPVVAIPPALTRSRIISHSLIMDERHITYLLGQKGHRKCLVKQPELPVLALLVRRIPKDATIEQRPVYISDHASNISRGIRGFAGRWKLDTVEVVDGRRVKVQRIPLIK